MNALIRLYIRFLEWRRDAHVERLHQLQREYHTIINRCQRHVEEFDVAARRMKR